MPTFWLHHPPPISAQMLNEFKYLNSVYGMASYTLGKRTYTWEYRFVKHIPVLCQWKRNHQMGSQILEFWAIFWLSSTCDHLESINETVLLNYSPVTNSSSHCLDLAFCVADISWGHLVGMAQKKPRRRELASSAYHTGPVLQLAFPRSLFSFANLLLRV